MPEQTLTFDQLLDSVVRLTNVGDKEFQGKYDGRTTTLEPGKTTMVTFAAMALWLGNPYSHNRNPRNRQRLSELNRLRAKYGAYDNPELWEQNKPLIEVYDAEGNRIITVVDDPDGTFLPPDEEDRNATAVDTLQKRIAQLDAEMDALRTALNQQVRTDQATTLGDAMPDIPPTPKAPKPEPTTGPSEDTPTRVRVTK